MYLRELEINEVEHSDVKVTLCCTWAVLVQQIAAYMIVQHPGHTRDILRDCMWLGGKEELIIMSGDGPLLHMALLSLRMPLRMQDSED